MYSFRFQELKILLDWYCVQVRNSYVLESKQKTIVAIAQTPF